jgi:DNA-binding transcriptional regulator GbsR (MarR family)
MGLFSDYKINKASKKLDKTVTAYMAQDDNRIKAQDITQLIFDLAHLQYESGVNGRASYFIDRDKYASVSWNLIPVIKDNLIENPEKTNHIIQDILKQAPANPELSKEIFKALTELYITSEVNEHIRPYRSAAITAAYTKAPFDILFPTGCFVYFNEVAYRQTFKDCPELLNHKYENNKNLAHRTASKQRRLLFYILDLNPSLANEQDVSGNNPLHILFTSCQLTPPAVEELYIKFPEAFHAKNNEGETVINLMKNNYQREVDRQKQYIKDIKKVSKEEIRKKFQTMKKTIEAAEGCLNKRDKNLASICAIFGNSASGDTPAPDPKSRPKQLVLDNTPKNNQV